MKRICFSLLLALLFLASCTIQKRSFRSGYYIEWRHCCHSSITEGKSETPKAKAEPIEIFRIPETAMNELSFRDSMKPKGAETENTASVDFHNQKRNFPNKGSLKYKDVKTDSPRAFSVAKSRGVNKFTAREKRSPDANEPEDTRKVPIVFWLGIVAVLAFLSCIGLFLFGGDIAMFGALIFGIALFPWVIILNVWADRKVTRYPEKYRRATLGIAGALILLLILITVAVAVLFFLP